MGKIDTITNNWRNPKFWTGTVLPHISKSIASKLLYDPYCRITLGKKNHIMEEDWDNLIILDACRYDTFKYENQIDGELEYRVSQAPATGPFLQKNLRGDHPDTVFIGGNPHIERQESIRFFAYIPAWRTHWDDDLGTVPPSSLTKLTKDISKQHPNKKVITHFVQPHTPYIGTEAIKELGNQGTFKKSKEWVEDGKDQMGEYFDPFDAIKNGEVSKETIISAYRENLRLVLEEIKPLLDTLDGKTVITSDHGEMFGEYAWPLPIKRFGHAGGLRTPKLVKVPWFIPDFEERKEITTGKIEAHQVNDDKTIEERLRSLGYR